MIQRRIKRSALYSSENNLSTSKFPPSLSTHNLSGLRKIHNMWPWQLLFVVIISLLSFMVAFGRAQTVNESSCQTEVIVIIVSAAIAGTEFIALIVIAAIYLYRKFFARYSILISTEDPWFTGRISYYELWKLVEYAFKLYKEDDKLRGAVGILKEGDGLQPGTYGSTDKDLYQELCRWKHSCDGPSVNQIKVLYDKCIDAKVVKSIRKLRDLRRIISDVPGSTYNDLEHILWQIGKESIEKISLLLKILKVENVAINVPSSGLKKIVGEASKTLEIWKEGLIPINPVVMLSLALEDLELSEGLHHFLNQVPDEEKQPFSDEEIEEKVHAVTQLHFTKTAELVASQLKSKDILSTPKLHGNETVLFRTCEMIKDWLELQECSNYDKRQTLQAKLSALNPVPDEGLFNAKVIKKKASGGKEKRVNVAFELLMTDILPLARALDVDKIKLEEYKVKSFDRSHLTMGTVGLVTMVTEL